MVQRELTITDLDDAVLLDLVRSSDPWGVVSIYVVLGFSQVVAALNDAQAERVIYDPELRYTGAVGSDGSLYAWSEVLGTVVEESRLTERIVERALETGARVTPLPGAASSVLAQAGGIAALLRW